MNRWIRNLRRKATPDQIILRERSISSLNDTPLYTLEPTSNSDISPLVSLEETKSSVHYEQISLELDKFNNSCQSLRRSGILIDANMRLSRCPLSSISMIQLKKVLLTSLLTARYPPHTHIAILITLLDESTQITLIDKTQRLFKITGQVSTEFFPFCVILNNPEQRLTVTLPTFVGKCILVSLRIKTTQIPLSDDLLPPVDSLERLLRSRATLSNFGLKINYSNGVFIYNLYPEQFNLKGIVQEILTILPSRNVAIIRNTAEDLSETSSEEDI